MSVIDNEGVVDIITRREGFIPVTETLLGMGVTSEQLAAVDVRYEFFQQHRELAHLVINLLPLVFIAGPLCTLPADAGQQQPGASCLARASCNLHRRQTHRQV